MNVELVEHAAAAAPSGTRTQPSAYLSADELLAGSALRFEVQVPAALAASPRGAQRIKLRPLTVADLHLISKATRDNDNLAAALMVKAAVEEPVLTLAQVNALPVGLLEFLLAQVNRISGLAIEPQALQDAAAQPLARAAHVLAEHFGWTPQQVEQLTLGQILLHLQMLRDAQVADHG